MEYKCILVYGLDCDELRKIKNRKIKTREITNNEALMTVEDIICDKSNSESYDELPKDEKALIFYGYNDKELRETIRFIRSFINDGVLAVVTEQSRKWTFKYLVEHLIEEREWYKAQQ